MGILNSAPEDPSPYISGTIYDGLRSVEARSGALFDSPTNRDEA